MGMYGERVLPRLIDRACGIESIGPLRQRVGAGLTGDVIEIGFGSGHNVGHYPSAVTSVTAIEPSDLAWRLAKERVAPSSVTVVRSGLDGQSLPHPADSFDCALSTWTMCSIPDLPAALRELRRVLRPGGRLHYVEHGLAPDTSVARWQHRLEPIQKRLAGGCHLTRQIVVELENAGFTISKNEAFYQAEAPKILGADNLGVAIN